MGRWDNYSAWPRLLPACGLQPPSREALTWEHRHVLLPAREGDRNG